MQDRTYNTLYPAKCYLDRCTVLPQFYRIWNFGAPTPISSPFTDLLEIWPATPTCNSEHANTNVNRCILSPLWASKKRNCISDQILGYPFQRGMDTPRSQPTLLIRAKFGNQEWTYSVRYQISPWLVLHVGLREEKTSPYFHFNIFWWSQRALQRRGWTRVRNYRSCLI